MKSRLAKVMHEIFFAPMIHHVLDAVQTLALDQTVVVIGHQKKLVREALKNYPTTTAVQEEQLGTGHAVLSAEDELRKTGGTVLILCGDTPLIRAATLRQMLQAHRDAAGKLTIMTTRLADPTNYGRIICDKAGLITKIVEEKDASAAQKRIDEINAGIYCVDADFLFRALKKVGSDNSQGEVYLTDIVAIANQDGQKVNKYVNQDAEEVLGVNSRVELARAHKTLQHRRNRALMLDGVTLLDPDSIFIEKHVAIGRDTNIHPNVIITGNSTVGEKCRLDAGVVIHNCHLGKGVTIGPYSCLENCRVAAGEHIAPLSLKIS